MKRTFDATVKFVFEKSKRNVNIYIYEKVNSMILWKLDERKCKINKLFTILKEFKQIQKNEKKKMFVVRIDVYWHENLNWFWWMNKALNYLK